MRTYILGAIVLLSACGPTRPRDDDREAIADYIIACINSGDVEEIDKYVVDKKQYSRSTPTCGVDFAPGWESRCNYQRNRALVLQAIKEIPRRYGKCVRGSTTYGAEGNWLVTGIQCGTTRSTIRLNKFVQLDDSTVLDTKYWVLNTDLILQGLLRPILK